MSDYAQAIGLLIALTAVSFVIGFKLWAISRDISFPLGMVAVYFWTAHGGWRIASACESGKFSASLARLGDRLVWPTLGGDYTAALFGYALFIISLGLAAVLRLKKTDERVLQEPMYLSHPTLQVLIGGLGIASALCVSDALGYAAHTGESAYGSVTHSGAGYWVALHQVLMRSALVANAVGLAVWAVGDRGRLCQGSWGPLTGYVYLFEVSLLGLVCSALGNKNELFQALITGISCYAANERRLRLVRVGVCAALALAVVAHIDATRGRTQTDPTGVSPIAAPLVSLVRSVESNEQFAAHLSMYAVLVNDVPIFYARSIVSLVFSVIPRALWPDRPGEIYEHYAVAVGAAEDQGFTIHHSTAWYLNFGVPGIILGGTLFGWLWSWTFNMRNSRSLRSQGIAVVFATLGFSLFTGAIPVLLRTGPEGYKMVVVECIGFPALVVYCSSLVHFRSRALLSRATLLRPARHRSIRGTAATV